MNTRKTENRNVVTAVRYAITCQNNPHSSASSLNCALPNTFRERLMKIGLFKVAKGSPCISQI